jgi:hypothetical protein
MAADGRANAASRRTGDQVVGHRHGHRVRQGQRALIVGGILAARPDDAIVGEEGTDTPGTSGIDWLIDPIDGTTNFLYGLPGWAVSIAAATAHGTQVGVVYVPAPTSCSPPPPAAAHGLNGAPIGCSTTDRPGDSRSSPPASATSPSGVRQQAQRIAVLLPQVRDMRRSAPPRPTCATWPPGGSTSTSRSGWAVGSRRRRADRPRGRVPHRQPRRWPGAAGVGARRQPGAVRPGAAAARRDRRPTRLLTRRTPQGVPGLASWCPWVPAS